MKMTAAHYELLKAKVALMAADIPRHLEILRGDPKVKNLEERLLWDVFHAAHIFDNYTYQEFDYEDSHIRTAMRHIFKDLNVKVSE